MLRPVRLGAAIATALALCCFCRRPAASRRPICRSRGLVCEGPPRWLGSGPDRSINAVYTHSIYAESYSGRTPRAAAAQGLSCSDCVGLLGHRADMRKQRRVRAAGDTLGQAKTGTAAGGLWLAMRRSLRGSAASGARAIAAAPRPRCRASPPSRSAPSRGCGVSLDDSSVSRGPAAILLFDERGQAFQRLHDSGRRCAPLHPSEQFVAPIL